MSRLFIGFALSEPLIQEILSWERNYVSWPVNFLSPENLHLTIVAPWEDKDKEEAKEIFSEINGLFKPLRATFSQIVFGPNPASPRLIWAKGWLEGRVAALKREIETIFNRPCDDRPFLAHLTLARFRPEDFPRLPARRLEEKINWEAIFDRLILFESHLLPAGAEYERLATMDLKY